MRPTWGMLLVLVAAVTVTVYQTLRSDTGAARHWRESAAMSRHWGEGTQARSEGTDDSTDAVRQEVATLAAGCFWGVEHFLRQLPGVISTRVGYTGGTVSNPTYERVCRGDTGHAEAVEVVFDPDRVSYEEVLRYFFRLHDPTTPNRQHNDVGTQYRSAIFTRSEEQRRIAEEVKAEVNASGAFSRPVVTEIVPAGTFWEAEEYHQDYLVKHPDGYNCHVLRPE